MAFILLSLVPLAVSNLAGYLSSRAAFHELVLENITKTAEIQAFELEDYLAAQEGLLEGTAANNQHLVRAMSSGEEAPVAFARPTLEQNLAGTVDRSEHLEAIAVLALGGDLLVTSESGWPKTREDCVLGDANGGGRFARLVDTAEHDLRLVGSVPIVDPGGKRLGTLCGRFGFSVHQRLLVERASSYVDGMVYIVDRSGEVICGSWHEHEHHVEPGHAVDGFLAGLATGGTAWAGVASTQDREPIYAAYAPAAELPWGVVVQVPASVAIAPLEQLKRRALFFGALLVVALVGFVTVLARRLVRPLHALVGAAGRIAGGRYGESVPIRGDDELSKLGREFNRMSVALKDSYERLDARVAERTRELEESRDFADLLLNSVEHRITVFDPALRILKANLAAQRHHGAEIVGAHCYTLFDGGDEPCDDCPVLEAFRTHRPNARERGAPDPESGEVLSIETFPVPSREGPPTAVIQVSRVITEEKRLQAQLLHQEKMAAFGTLAAGFAHEIGNPLSSISTELQMMALNPEPASVTESVGVLRSQVDRVARLLRQLTGLSRKKGEEADAVSLGEVVDDVVHLLRHDPRSRGVQVTAHVGTTVPPVWASRDALIQVFLNLCLNALDALDGTGSLDIRVDGAGEQVIVEVSDTGAGIDPGVLDRIFEPFFTTKPPGRGTGLGLFVTRRAVADLGGRIEVGSRHEFGTTFTVTLPAWREEP
jgi:signal transduction histidine kinase